MENEEIWLPIKGYENYYEVSTLGRVRALDIYVRNDGNFAGGFIKNRKVRDQQTNKYGYKTIKLCKHGKCQRYLVHRLVAKAFIPTQNYNYQINHIDGDKTNNTITNLEWVTPAQNMKHAWETGLINSEHSKGSNHANSKLTEKDVIEIRKLAAEKQLTRQQICDKFGISISTYKGIVTKRSWRHV